MLILLMGLSSIGVGLVLNRVCQRASARLSDGGHSATRTFHFERALQDPGVAKGCLLALIGYLGLMLAVAGVVMVLAGVALLAL